MFNNAGYSVDLTCAVMERAMLHCENSYKIPVMRCVGQICRTNIPSNTAFRGFGGPQGMFIVENIIDKLAATLNMPPEQVCLSHVLIIHHSSFGPV